MVTVTKLSDASRGKSRLFGSEILGTRKYFQSYQNELKICFDVFSLSSYAYIILKYNFIQNQEFSVDLGYFQSLDYVPLNLLRQLLYSLRE